LHELDLVFVHQFGSAFVDHARQVGDPDIFTRDAQFDQQPQASQSRSACTRGDQLDLFGVLAHHFETVQDGRTHHDGGAVLVVVEDRDLHPLAQLALDVEAIRCLDVFEVDATKRWLQRSDDLDQLVGVFFIDLDVEDVNARELLEQNALAFHDRLAGQGANVAQTQNGRAVGHHTHQVATAGVLEGVGRVFDDFFARRGHTGRIGQGQIVLVHQLFGGRDGHFAGGGELVVFQSGFAQLGAFFFGEDLVGHCFAPL